MNKQSHIGTECKISKTARHGGKASPAAAAKRHRTQLAKEVKRLLNCLAKPQALVFVDPTDEAGIIVAAKNAAVSVSAGRFARSHAEVLVGQDLARWQKAGRLTLEITGAGRAHLRRDAANQEEDGFFDQHRQTASVQVETETGTKRVRVDLDESPLDWLRRRKGRDGQRLISSADYEAGERLRRDLMQAGLLPSVTARWDAMPGSSGAASPSDATDRMVAAGQRVRHAFDAIGSDFSDLLLDLCGFLKGLELIEQERHWPPRSAKVVVRLALSRLADHYGIATSARGPAASRGIRAWQAVVIEGGLR
jgi:hypothetical protein